MALCFLLILGGLAFVDNGLPELAILALFALFWFFAFSDPNVAREPLRRRHD